MTDPEVDADAVDEVPPMSHEEAAEVVENDPALQEAGADSPSSSSDSPSES